MIWLHSALYGESVVCLWGRVGIRHGINLDSLEKPEVLSKSSLQYTSNARYTRLHTQIRGYKNK